MTTLASLATTSRGTPGSRASNFLPYQNATIKLYILVDPLEACCTVQFLGLLLDAHHPDNPLCISIGISIEPHDRREFLRTECFEGSFTETTRYQKTRRSVTGIRTGVAFLEGAFELAAPVSHQYSLGLYTNTHSSSNSSGALSIEQSKPSFWSCWSA
jgi:hypothetical protein